MNASSFSTRLIHVMTSFVVLLATAATSAAASTSDFSAHLLGHVRDEVTGRPIKGASVTFESTGASKVTSELGYFTFSNVPLGVHFLSVDALGYAERRVQVRLSTDQAFETDLYLSNEAVELEGLTVEVIPRRTFNELRDLDIRIGRGTGQFILRTEIERRGGNLIDLLRGRRSVRIGGGGGTMTGRSVQLRRAVRLTSIAPGQNTIVNCYPAIFMDGRRYSRRASLGDEETDLTEFISSDLDAVEVYAGSSVPAIFGGGDAACGAILIWTRRGPDRRSGN
jgi:carboxypeptidase-like protein